MNSRTVITVILAILILVMFAASINSVVMAGASLNSPNAYPGPGDGAYPGPSSPVDCNVDFPPVGCDILLTREYDNPHNYPTKTPLPKPTG